MTVEQAEVWLQPFDKNKNYVSPQRLARAYVEEIAAHRQTQEQLVVRDSQIAYISRERDSLREQLAETRSAINVDGSLAEHQQFVDIARDGAHALNQINSMAEQLAQAQKALTILLRYREHTSACEIDQTDFCTCGMAQAAHQAIDAALRAKRLSGIPPENGTVSAPQSTRDAKQGDDSIEGEGR